MEALYANDFYYLGLIVLLPLIGAIVNGLLGSRLPTKLVDVIASGSVLGSFFLSVLGVMTLANGQDEHLTYTAYKWIYSGDLAVDISFLLDPLSSVMILVVTGVGFLIHLYSVGYMADDPGKWKYFSFLNFFIFSMLLLVLGKNMLVTFIGWEGVGACSYLLIGFWYLDDAKAWAGQKAFIVNRIGDFGFLLGLFLLYWETGTLDYLELHEAATTAASAATLAPIALPAVLLIFLGCTGKSAQIPLFTWLPDAMAGPTPVSALIHAATMVTSGVYLLSRLNALVTISYEAMLVIAVIGCLTAFMAATIALVQNDIKGVLAYSTVSQLGYMFLAIGVGSFVGAIFHLMTHAFFKALLFLGSGSVIHSMGGEQDIRKMGGLHKYMPITSWTFLIACFAISGFPFLFSGFFSKDLILWSAFSNVHVFQISGVLDGSVNIAHLTSQLAAPLQNGGEVEALMLSKVIYNAVGLLGLITAGLTAFYMFRLYILTFLGEFRGGEETESHLHESPQSMTIPLASLAILSVVGGWIGWPHFIAHWGALPEKLQHKMLAFEEWLHPVFETAMTYRIHNRFGDHAGSLEALSMAGSIVVGLGGIGVAFLMYHYRPGMPEAIAEQTQRLYKVLVAKYKVDEFYDLVFVRGSIGFGKLQAAFDRYVIDGLAVNGTGFIAESGGKILRHLQSGNVQKYATYIVLAVVLALVALL